MSPHHVDNGKSTYLAKYLNISTILYAPTVFFVKLSILFQYLRIFVPNRKGNMVLYVMIHLLICTTLVFYTCDVIIAIVMREPCEKIWAPNLHRGNCFDFQAVFRATGTFNMINDILILILPMKCIWDLQMEKRRKLMIMGIFGTGVS